MAISNTLGGFSSYSTPDTISMDDLTELERKKKEEEDRKREQLLALQSTQPIVPANMPTSSTTAPISPAMPANTQQAMPMAQPTEPMTPVNPQSVSQYNVAGTTGGQGLQMPQQPGMQTQQPTEIPLQASTQPQTQFQSIQDNLDDLLKYRQDQNVPEYLRKRAGDRAYELMNQNYRLEQASNKLQSMVSSGDTQAITRVLTNKPRDEEGSWLKFALYGFISPQLAQAEAIKLGIAPTKWEDSMLQTPNGESISVQLQRRPDGKIVGGTKADGTPLTTRELELAQTGLGKHVTTTAETYIDQEGNRYRSQTDERGNARMINIATGQRFSGDASKLQRQTDVSSMARVDYGLATDLLKKHSGNVLDMMKEYETIKGPMSPEARQEFMQRYGYGTTVQPPQRPTQAMPSATTMPGTPSVPTQGPVSPAQVAQPSQQPIRPSAASLLPSAQKPTTQIPPTTGGAITGLPGGQVGGGGAPSGSIASMKQGLEIGTAAAKEKIQVAGKRSESFNKILDEEVRPQAQAGDTVSQVRKQQFAIFNRPGVDSNKIFGLYNAAAEGTGAQGASIIRDIIGGTFKPEAEVSQRLALLNLTPEEKSALMEYNIANQRINAATLKQTAGPGSVSDAEQRANRESNVDPTKIPALGAYNAMAQSQFSGDLARYKADWADKQPATNALQLDKAWRKESSQLSQMYGDIAKQRAEYISNNGATTNAVKEGYKRFPIPEYDPQTETWKKTKPLSSFNR